MVTDEKSRICQSEVRIRIRTKMSRILNTAYNRRIKNTDLDSQHCVNVKLLSLRNYRYQRIISF
jgi:hypothetical protein